MPPDGRIIQGQSYAIGVERVREITDVLRRGRSLGWSGIGFDYPTTEELKLERIPPGIVLTHAVQGTAGARAGLSNKRALLVEVNGVPIGNSLAGYCDAAATLRSGEKAMFTVREASGRMRTVPVSME